MFDLSDGKLLKTIPFWLKPRLINANKSGYIAAPKFRLMEYNRIVAVTGMPGLYEVLSSKSDGAIVRSLDDKSTKFVSSRIHNLSHLESIEVYTQRDNVTLSDVFIAMKEKKEKLPDVKDNKALKGYFEKVFPELDFERVYASDMKKMVKWYEVLAENEVDFTVKPVEEEEPVEAEVTADENKPKAKAAVAEKVTAKPAAKEVKEPKAPKAEKKEEPKAPAKAAAKTAAPKKSAEKAPAAKAAAKTPAKKTAAKGDGKKKG